MYIFHRFNIPSLAESVVLPDTIRHSPTQNENLPEGYADFKTALIKNISDAIVSEKNNSDINFHLHENLPSAQAKLILKFLIAILTASFPDQDLSSRFSITVSSYKDDANSVLAYARSLAQTPNLPRLNEQYIERGRSLLHTGKEVDISHGLTLLSATRKRLAEVHLPDAEEPLRQRQKI